MSLRRLAIEAWRSLRRPIPLVLGYIGTLNIVFSWADVHRHAREGVIELVVAYVWWTRLERAELLRRLRKLEETEQPEQSELTVSEPQ